MSKVFSMSLRDRWAAREVLLHKWIVQPGGTFKYGDTLAEVSIDGIVSTISYREEVDGRAHADPEGGALSHYVDEGQEVGPWGMLLEYTDWNVSSPGPRPRDRRYRRIRYRRRESYPKVFISYRRDDGEAYAGRLHEALSRALGAGEIFMDQFSIRPGEVFPWTIQQAVWHSKVMLCLMGAKWSSPQPDGKHRLNSPWDYLRREVTGALDLGHCLMPILLPGGNLPDRMLLSDGMDPLSDLQALSISQRHWDADVSEIVNAIRLELSTQSPT